MVLPTDDDVVRFVEALTFFTPLHPVYVLPGFDVSPYDNLYPNPRVTAQRIKWLAAAQEARPGQIFVSSVMALLQRTLPFDDLSRRTLRIRKGQSLDSDFYKQLGLLGYQNVSVVDEVGGYALRGGILDIYSPFHIQPTRLELFGDEVESIRPFDPETQRSEDGDLSEMVLLPLGKSFTTKTISRMSLLGTGRPFGTERLTVAKSKWSFTLSPSVSFPRSGVSFALFLSSGSISFRPFLL